MTIIVGADLASRSGFCFGRPDTVPVVQVVSAPVTGADLGAWGAFYRRFFTRFFTQLNDRLERGEGILVCFEAPTLPREKWDPVRNKMVGATQLATTRKLHGLGLLLETECTILREDFGFPIEVTECHLQTIKRELGGKGDAQKAEMVFAARRAGIVLPDGAEASDGADAFGAFLVCVRERFKEQTPMWDRRLYSSPGARK